MRPQILLIISVAAMVAGCKTLEPTGSAIDNDQNVMTGGPITGTTIQDLPQAVKNTLEEEVPEAEIARMHKITDSKGNVSYEISFTEPGKTPKMYISEDGKILAPPRTQSK
jgi:hypothetical protein